jgi:hypothetical protein
LNSLIIATGYKGNSKGQLQIRSTFNSWWWNSAAAVETTSFAEMIHIFHWWRELLLNLGRKSTSGNSILKDKNPEK